MSLLCVRALGTDSSQLNVEVQMESTQLKVIRKELSLHY